MSLEKREQVSQASKTFNTILDVAQFGVKVGFGLAKAGTKLGLGISRAIIDGIGQGTGTESATQIVSMTLSAAEFCALQGIELGHFWTDFGLGAATTSVGAVNNVFGSTDTALALETFVALVQREMSHEGIANLSTTEVLSGIMAWISLQRLTVEPWRDIMHQSCTHVNIEGVHALLAAEPQEEPVIVSQSNQVVLMSIGSPTEIVRRTDNVTYQTMSDLKRYMRFSMGAYGKTVVQFLTKGTIPLPSFERFTRIYNTAPVQHTNVDHMVEYVDISPEDLFHSSYDVPQTDVYTPTFYIMLDHAQAQVVLCLRGTLSFADLMADLTCEHLSFEFDGQTHSAHSGMLKAAQAIGDPGYHSRVFEAVSAALDAFPEYGLTITGHSLGGGVAALLAVLWADKNGRTTTVAQGRPIRCFAYGCPQVMDLELSKKTAHFITSFLVGSDVVPRLGLGTVRDLVGIVGYMNTNAETRTSLISGSLPNAFELRSTIFRNEMSNEKLFPGGRMLWMDDVLYEVQDPHFVFGQMLLDSSFMSDHLPVQYSKAVSLEN
ncbi:Alpha/Beta hydrolase protein [Gorgonomyces haynaldii]|nr:Alpha/Beta hydrolase protein [Gorgonomyces haynaldii]